MRLLHATLKTLQRQALLAALLSLGLAGCATQPVRAPNTWPPLPPNATALETALRAQYQHWAGTPYRYGGSGANGIDCSGFVRRALGPIRNRPLPRTTAAQARIGRAITRSELTTGDFVFFKTGSPARHVGIYIGDGRFMHASSSRGVTISNLGNRYWRRHYWQARRLPRDQHR